MHHLMPARAPGIARELRRQERGNGRKPFTENVTPHPQRLTVARNRELRFAVLLKAMAT